MTAAIYIRWSTDDQGTGTTLDEQREGCLKWAGDKGLTVCPSHIFIDDGVSGARENRPALDRLNRAIQDGSISTVIVYKLDRLARKPYLAYKLVEQDWRGKASLVSVTEAHIDTTTTVGQLGFGIAAVFAAHERNTIRDRTMSGKRRRAAEGRNPGLRPPFGYRIADKRFLVVEHEAVIVRRIYADYLSGRTVGHIACALNEAGIRTRAGGPWHISTVGRVLANPAYNGTLVYRDISAGDGFPVIIAAHLWEQAQSLRNQKAKMHPRRLSSDSSYILSGRLVCAKCGRPMNGRVSRNGKYQNRYYACTGHIQFRDCDCRTVRQDFLEGAVIDHLLRLLDEAELGRRIAQRRSGVVDLLQREVAALECSLSEIEHQLARLSKDYRRGKLDVDTFNDLRKTIDTEKAPLAGSILARRSALANIDAEAKGEPEAVEAVNIRRAWEGLSYSRRKQVIHLLTERIQWDYHSQQVTVETTI